MQERHSGTLQWKQRPGLLEYSSREKPRSTSNPSLPRSSLVMEMKLYAVSVRNPSALAPGSCEPRHSEGRGSWRPHP